MQYSKIPLRNILKNKGRSISLILITAFLVFSMFGGWAVINSLKNGMESLEARLGADVIVVPDSAKSKTDLEAILLQGTPGYFYMNKSVLDKIAQTEGVELVSPQYFLASAKAGCCSVAVQIIGFDPDTDFTIKPWIQSKYKDNLELYDVVIGADINSYVGSEILLYNTNCKVVAKLDATGTALDTAIYTNADTVKKLIVSANDQGINVLSDNSPDNVISSVYIKVMDGYDPQAVTDDINIHVRRVQAVRTKNMLTGISDSLSAVSSAVTVLIVVIWVLSVVLLTITYSMLIGERKKEFAILRIIGTSRKKLALLVLYEAALISFAGSIIGILLTSAIVFPFSSLIEESLELPYLLPNISGIIIAGFLSILIAVLIGSLTSAYSAGKLSRVDTAAILRSDV